MGKLNAKLVEHTKSKDKEYRLPDGEGLFLRVRPSGAKSWLFCFRLGGDRTWLQMTLGSLQDVSLKEARGQLKALRGLVAAGLDPRHARAVVKAENQRAITMQALFDVWIEFVKLSGEVSIIWAKRHEDRWRLHLKKILGNVLARDVTRSHLAAALDAMARKGIREETRKALTTLNLMLDYGLTRQYIDQNPARMLKPKDFAVTANKPRDSALTLVELRHLWHALDNTNGEYNKANDCSKMSIVTTSAIKILILTGARRGEVAAMRWDELDLGEGVWSLPQERTKNRQAHIIYLSVLAIEILKQLRPITGHSCFVFDTGRYANDGHIHQDTLTGVIARLRGTVTGSKKKVSDTAPLADMKPFSIHDLRRSAATAWGEYLKTEPHVIERMLNHQPLNKLVAIYQRAVYAEEQRAAWSAWGTMIEHQIAQMSCNVVSINIAENNKHPP